jgi:enoyl-CoA hydratase
VERTENMAASGAAAVSCVVADGIAWISLDGPASRNALDRTTADALVAACDAVDANASVGAAVIAGEHGTFCSGAAREILAGLAREPAHVAYDELGALYRSFQRVGQLTVPSLAMVEGAAVGAGLNLALAADIRIVAEDARLISGFARAGIHPGGGHLHLLDRVAGRETAAAVGVFARPLTGVEARARGLAWDAVPDHRLRAAVVEACSAPAADPGFARAVKASLNRTTSGSDAWATATEVERARQLWSLTRPRPSHPEDL